MIYFLYGKDTYQINEKLQSLKKRFIDTHGDLNIREFQGDELNFDKYSDAIYSLPFLSRKKLVIIKNIFSLKDESLKKNIAASLVKIPSDSVLIFAEFGTPDQRTSLFKTLNKPKQSQEIKPLEGLKLEKWVKEKVLECGGGIDKIAVFKLILFTGNDLWRLENEINKLVLYAKARDRQIEEGDIDLLVIPSFNPNVFELLDAIINKEKHKAVRILHQLVLAGENELKIFSMIAYQLRNLLIVNDFMSQGFNDRDISKKSSLHPFVVKKTLELLKRYDYDHLKSQYFYLSEMDRGVKSGQVDIKVALLMLIQRMT